MSRESSSRTACLPVRKMDFRAGVYAAALHFSRSEPPTLPHAHRIRAPMVNPRVQLESGIREQATHYSGFEAGFAAGLGKCVRGESWCSGPNPRPSA